MFSALLLGALCWQDPAKMIKELETLNKPKLLIVGCYHFQTPALTSSKPILMIIFRQSGRQKFKKLTNPLPNSIPPRLPLKRPPIPPT